MKHVGPVDDHPHGASTVMRSMVMFTLFTPFPHAAEKNGRRLTSHQPLNLQNPWMVWCQQMPYPPKRRVALFFERNQFYRFNYKPPGGWKSHDQRLRNAAGKGGKPLQMAWISYSDMGIEILYVYIIYIEKNIISVYLMYNIYIYCMYTHTFTQACLYQIHNWYGCFPETQPINFPGIHIESRKFLHGLVDHPRGCGIYQVRFTMAEAIGGSGYPPGN